MKNSSSFMILFATCALVAALLFVATPGHAASQQPPDAAAPDPGATLFVQMCGDCHDSGRIVSMRRTKADWQDVLTTMIDKGAVGSDKDFQNVFEYLRRTYGKVFINSATQEELTVTVGVSKKDADAIIAYRKANGLFVDLDGIKKVPDIDVKKITDHKDAIVF